MAENEYCFITKMVKKFWLLSIKPDGAAKKERDHFIFLLSYHF